MNAELGDSPWSVMAGSSWGVDAATNRMTGIPYDGNGNQLQGSCYGGCDQVYDIENRIWGSTTRADGGAIGYDAGNKRVWDRRDTGGGNFEERLYFFGADGVRLGEYRLEYYKYQSTTALRVHRVRENYYFGSKLTYSVTDAGGEGVYTDRLGSVVRRGSTNFKYRRYGDEYPSVTGQDREKFGTYWRDGMTGLDYADQRYYAGSWGRFMTPDPYQASGGPGEPGSWGRYGYVGGDPVNRRDSTGLAEEDPDSGGDDKPRVLTPAIQVHGGSRGTIFLDPVLAAMYFSPGPMSAQASRARAARSSPEKNQLLPGQIAGFQSAEERAKNADCAREIGPDAARLLGSTPILVEDLGIITEVKASVARAQGSYISVNSNVFLDPANAASSRGNYNYLSQFEQDYGLREGALTVSLFQAIYLLHEVAHIGRKYPEETGTPAEQLEKSIQNTVNVIKNCFKDLMK